MAVNLGDDTDTTGAVTGQIVGAYTGLSGLPAQWRESIVLRQEMLSVIERLHQLERKI